MTYKHVAYANNLPTDNIEAGDIIIVDGCANYAKYIWTICPKCNQGRWITLLSTKRRGYTGLCAPCFQEQMSQLMTDLRMKSKPEIKYQELYEAIDRCMPIHYPINGLINLYTRNTTDAVAQLLLHKGIKITGMVNK